MQLRKPRSSATGSARKASGSILAPLHSLADGIEELDAPEGPEKQVGCLRTHVRVLAPVPISSQQSIFGTLLCVPAEIDPPRSSGQQRVAESRPPRGIPGVFG